MVTRFTALPAHAAKHLPLKTGVLNQKGGVGKTGLTVGVAGALAERGRRVLCIDLDPQGHLTAEALGIAEADPDKPNLAAALVGDYNGPLEPLIVQRDPHANGAGGQLDLIPTTLAMFVVVRKLYAGRAGETRLARLLDEHLPAGVYDHVLIDCPPSLDIVTDNALVASDGLLIPVQPNSTSLRALRLLIDQIAEVEHDLQLTPRELYGLVPGVYRRPLTAIDTYKMAELEKYGTPVDPSVPALPILAHLPLATVVPEAWLHGQPVVDYKPKAPISAAYRRLAVRLDVAAGLSPEDEWRALPELESLIVPPDDAASDAEEGVG